MGVKRRQRHVRSDVSLISQFLGELMSARAGTGTPVPYDELPITQGACTLICDALSVMELYPVDLEGERVDEHYPVLIQPDPDEDRGETIHKIGQSMFWTGNAFALKGPIGRTMAVDWIRVFNPDAVWPDPTVTGIETPGYQAGGQHYSADEIQLFKMNDDPRRGRLGQSPLKQCATALDTYGWAYRYLGDFFAQGGNPSLILKSKMNLDNTKITELAEEWIAARQQARPTFLPHWLEAEVPPSSGELSVVVEILNMAAAEFARMINMPASLVNAPALGNNMDYANVADEFRRWLAVSLGTTWIARIERGFSALLPLERRAKLDPAPLFRPDLFPAPATPAAPVAQPVTSEVVG